MLALAGQEGMISLAGGHPDPALLPADEARRDDDTRQRVDQT